MSRHVLLVLVLLSIGSVTTAAEECGWLSTDKVDQAFPDYAPWTTMVGGKVGSCKFLSSRRRPPNIFGANQMVKNSAAEAESFVRSLKTSMAKDYEVQAAPALGKEGFSYKPKPGSGEASARSLFFVGHRQQVAVLGSLTFQNAITPAQREAGEALLLAALALADDDRALAAASNCPYFDAKLIRQLLPGKDFSQHVFGATSCMANAEGKVVILSIVEDAGAERLAAISGRGGTGCTSEPLPKLGSAASIQYGCTQGNPRAAVRFVSGNKMFDFSLAPGQEPTAAERALLINLAEHAFSRQQ